MSTTKFTYQQAQKPRSYVSLKLRPSERLCGVDTGANVAAENAFFIIIFLEHKECEQFLAQFFRTQRM